MILDTERRSQTADWEKKTVDSRRQSADCLLAAYLDGG